MEWVRGEGDGDGDGEGVRVGESAGITLNPDADADADSDADLIAAVGALCDDTTSLVCLRICERLVESRAEVVLERPW